MKTKSPNIVRNVKPSRKSGPPYLMGLLGLIPLVGFFVGTALLLFGIFKYRSRVLSIIGVACMLFTVIFYYSMYRMSKSADAVSTLWNETAQRQLNALVKDVEFYKLQHGSYPDSLAQVDNAAEFVFSHDPIQLWLHDNKVRYNYENLGERYLLFSSGADGVPGTTDDIFPQVDNSAGKIGWTKE